MLGEKEKKILLPGAWDMEHGAGHEAEEVKDLSHRQTLLGEHSRHHVEKKRLIN